MKWLLSLLIPALPYILMELIAHAYVGLFERSIPYQLARWLTPAGWIWQSPSCGCQRCLVSPRLMEFHDTTYQSWGVEAEIEQLAMFDQDQVVVGGSRAIMVLCQHCWEELPPKKRWGYYEYFLNKHARDPHDIDLIKKATLAGK